MFTEERLRQLQEDDEEARVLERILDAGWYSGSGPIQKDSRHPIEKKQDEYNIRIDTIRKARGADLITKKAESELLVILHGVYAESKTYVEWIELSKYFDHRFDEEKKKLPVVEKLSYVARYAPSIIVISEKERKNPNSIVNLLRNLPYSELESLEARLRKAAEAYTQGRVVSGFPAIITEGKVTYGLTGGNLAFSSLAQKIHWGNLSAYFVPNSQNESTVNGFSKRLKLNTL
jgi:hypothetical protein